MSAVASAPRISPAGREHPESVGPVGRLGRWTVDHGRVVAVAWVIVAIGLGFFAPKVESALSGAGWQANGSESVQARKLIQTNFAGLSSSALMVVVHSSSQTVSDTGFRSTIAAVERTLRTNHEVASVVGPRPGASISPDRHTAIVTAGAQGRPDRDGRSRRLAEGQAARARNERRQCLADRRLRDVERLQHRQPQRR